MLKYLLVALTLTFSAHASDMSPLTALAQKVSRSEHALQREFASVILLQLAEVYLGEAGIARRQAEAAVDTARLPLNWALGVEREAQRYLSLHDSVQRESPLRVTVLHACKPCVMLSVAGQSVLVSHPRPSQQEALEAVIIADFCRRVDCMAIMVDSGQIPHFATPE